MNKVLIILGLPGSGKSTLAKKVSEKRDYLLYDFDDHVPKFMKEKMSRGELITEDDRLRCTEILIGDLKDLSKKGNVVCACVLTKDSHRKSVLSRLDNVRIFNLEIQYCALARRLAQRKDHFVKISLLERIHRINEPFTVSHRSINADQDEESVLSELNRSLDED